MEKKNDLKSLSKQVSFALKSVLFSYAKTFVHVGFSGGIQRMHSFLLLRRQIKEVPRLIRRNWAR